MKKRYVISLIIVALLLVVSGVSYAYFSATVNNNGTTSTATTGTMSIEFIDGSTVSLENAIPGSSVTKTFKVKNTGDIATTYNISLTDLTNTFADKADLVYTLTSATGANKGSTQIPSTSSYIILNQAIGVGVTQEYSLTITFKETYNSQDDNQGKTFKGTVSISTEEVATSPSVPELYQGLIPVTYDATGNTIVADTTQEWYNYSSHNWANAVLVDCSSSTIQDKYFNTDMSLKSSVVGTTISMDEILQMYVWIPRYKYLLWNAENSESAEQAINIMFEDKNTPKSTGSTNGTWLTHPAFTFGDTELNGIWVGKFETRGTTTQLMIKPNLNSYLTVPLGDMFNATRNQELTYSTNYGINSNMIDTHIIKNVDWGAVTYLSSSIYGRYNDASTCISSGCKVWNNNSNYATGCAGSSASSSSLTTTACDSGYDWSTLGVSASTTGNIYGIYDMAGGMNEYAMGNISDSSGNYSQGNSGLDSLESKYYDSYKFSNSTNYYDNGKLGDATRETITTTPSSGDGWYGDHTYFPTASGRWFLRGGSNADEASAGLFYFNSNSGYAYDHYGYVSFRSVLTAE